LLIFAITNHLKKLQLFQLVILEAIENMNENNLHKVAELSIALWPDCELDEMKAHYKNVFASDTAACFLLRNESDYLGFIELNMRNDYVEGAEELPVAYIEGLFITQPYRHKGYGRLLVQKAEDWARKKGLTQLCSDTEQENNASIEFHNLVGFTEISRIVCFAKDL
jgi:aminoglycoside 6'-N-acetyltransferase I